MPLPQLVQEILNLRNQGSVNIFRLLRVRSIQCICPIAIAGSFSVALVLVWNVHLFGFPNGILIQNGINIPVEW